MNIKERVENALGNLVKVNPDQRIRIAPYSLDAAEILMGLEDEFSGTEDLFGSFKIEPRSIFAEGRPFPEAVAEIVSLLKDKGITDDGEGGAGIPVTSLPPGPGPGLAPGNQAVP